MNKPLCVVAVLAFALFGCAGQIPYRTAGFVPAPECMDIYKQYSDGQKLEPPDSENMCWLRSIEEHGRYDLLVAEFDDQGWIQGSADLPRPNSDNLYIVFERLNRLYEKHHSRGLSLVVFVHGWHHSAKAEDDNVQAFRKLLSDLELMESERLNRRVVGLYIGWRGDSLTPSLINWATFWERKSTAEKVSQGSVRELFYKLDVLRSQADAKSEANPSQYRKIRMLTIGHSFGGLITFESLSSEFISAAEVFDKKKKYPARMGDLVVIVNPAFEGTRYEPLKIAGQRLRSLKKDQLPVTIIATSQADWATRVTFPLARHVSTLLESTPGAEGAANVYTVGHNERYTTHKLSKCAADDKTCLEACGGAGDPKNRKQTVENEFRQMKAGPAINGFKTRELLCSQMLLTATEQWWPESNPFWVVETTGEIMRGHNDIFNENFQSFIRQMYLAVMTATDKSAPSTKPTSGDLKR